MARISKKRTGKPVSGVGKPVSRVGKPVSRVGKPVSRVGARAKKDAITLSLAQRKLQALIRRARAESGLLNLAPAQRWTVDLHLVAPLMMTQLNAQYRGKKYATDVLSFDAPAVFRSQGHLGELVLCTSVLHRQARELGHPPSRELEILLAHGLLHLLGFDHERGPRAAREMGKWEALLLTRSTRRAWIGLIDRNLQP